MHQHRLNAILQRHGARVASPACASQLQHDNTILKAPQLDITAILLDRGTDASLQQFLDHADNLVIVFVVGEGVGDTTFLCALRAIALDGRHDGLAGSHGLRDETEDLGLDVRPLCVAGLGHGDEVGAVEDGGDALDIEELGGERGGVWRRECRARGEVFEESGREIFGKDAVVGNEFQCLDR